MKGWTIVATLCLVALLSVSGWAQQSPLDQGEADSVFFEIAHMPDMAAGDSALILEVYYFNDVQNVANASAGFAGSPG